MFPVPPTKRTFRLIKRLLSTKIRSQRRGSATAQACRRGAQDDEPTRTRSHPLRSARRWALRRGCGWGFCSRTICSTNSARGRSPISLMAGPISAKSRRSQRRSETATEARSIRRGPARATGSRLKPTRPSGAGRSPAPASSSCGRASSTRPACARCSERRSIRGSSPPTQAGRRARQGARAHRPADPARCDPLRGRLHARLFRPGRGIRRRAPADNHLHQRL